tara:strand:- start:13729 stop:14427 length:699 start_codon:yes stop_codon:yes gene_type:complete
MSKTLIFTATYNEKGNIKKLIYDINKFNKDVDILVIDDNSPDKTWEILQQLEKDLPNLKVIIRDSKSGLDTAHKLAYEYAKNNNYTNFISMDADLSHDPSEIPNIMSHLNEFPFVIGSRYSLGGKCEMNGFRLILSVVGNKIFKYFLKINCNEFTSSYRGFNLIKLERFDFNLINSKGYSFFMETIFRINRLNYEIKEIPIIFKNRAQGKSKIPKIEIFRTLKNILLLKFFG